MVYSQCQFFRLFSFCSKELLDALGVVSNTLPPFIYRMRELGYPPGWLKEAEMENSGLMLYDGKSKMFCFFSPKTMFFAENLSAKQAKIDEVKPFAKFLFQASGEEDSNGHNKDVCYDVSKLVDFPGFNVSPPSNVRDVSGQWCPVASVSSVCLFSTI